LGNRKILWPHHSAEIYIIGADLASEMILSGKFEILLNSLDDRNRGGWGSPFLLPKSLRNVGNPCPDALRKGVDPKNTSWKMTPVIFSINCTDLFITASTRTNVMDVICLLANRG